MKFNASVGYGINTQKIKESKKNDIEQKESTSAVDVVVMPEANSSNEELEAEKRKKRNKRNIGWSLVDD